MIQFYQDLDLPYAGFKVPLTFKIGGIGDLIGYVGGGSTEFELEATPRNEALLSEFKGRSVPCLLQVDDREMQGRLLVKRKKRTRGITVYSCQFDDLQSELAVKLKNTSLRSIYLEDFNHIWNAENVKDTTRTEGWIYPLIYYTDEAGANFSPNVLYKPIFDQGLFPAVFVHTIFTRIFQKVGYSVSSKLLNDNQQVFMKLIEPFTSGNWSKDGAGIEAGVNRRVNAGLTDAVLLTSDVTWRVTPFDRENGAGAAYYNTTTYRYTPDIDIRCQFIIGFQALNLDTTEAGIEFRVWNATTNTVVAYMNGNSAGQLTRIPAQSNVQETFFKYSPDIQLEAGNEYEVQYRAFGFSLVLDQYSYFQWVTLSDLQQGDTIDLASTLPDVSCADYLADIARVLCIAFDVDPEAKRVYFDTWNNFFQSKQNAIDLTEQINIEDVQEEYIPTCGQRNYFLWNSDTFYGSGGYAVENDYLEREQTAFALLHSPTEMHEAFQLIVPKIVGLGNNMTVQNGSNVFNMRYPKTTPRLLLVQAIDPGTLNPNLLLGIPIQRLVPATVVDYLESINYAWFYNPYDNIKLDASLDLVFQGTFEPSERVDDSFNLMDIYWKERVKYNQDYLTIRATGILGAVHTSDSKRAMLEIFRRPIFHESLGYFRLDEVVDYVDADTPCLFVLSKLPEIDNSGLLELPPIAGKGAGSESNAAPLVITNGERSKPHGSWVLTDNSSSGTDVEINIDNELPYFDTIGAWTIAPVGGHDAIFFPEAGKYYISVQGEFDSDGGDAEITYRIYSAGNDLLIEKTSAVFNVHRGTIHISNSENIPEGSYIKIFATFSNNVTFGSPFGYYTIFKTD
jgi:hypothetical protein